MGRASSEAELRQLVTERWGALVRFGLLLTGDAGLAEDLVQSALERCWPRWSKIRIDSPERYVKATMANLSASRWRRRRVREVAFETLTPDGDPPGWASTLVEHSDRIAQRDELWHLLCALPPRMRAVVVLRFVEDLSEAETARMLGCSIGTVKSQTFRGLHQLRDALTRLNALADVEVQP
ncbi:MAG: SigE family RNA polymerase sigma factor [Kineosporiaceae bacterium]